MNFAIYMIRNSPIKQHKTSILRFSSCKVLIFESKGSITLKKKQNEKKVEDTQRFQGFGKSSVKRTLEMTRVPALIESKRFRRFSVLSKAP